MYAMGVVDFSESKTLVGTELESFVSYKMS